MKTSDNQYWEDMLQKAYFPVMLTDVHVGNPSRHVKRYRAVIPVDEKGVADPFAIVTNRYRLIRNEDVVDLGYEAFERIFDPSLHTRMTVFNVVLANSRGSFFADFTTPDLNSSIPIPRFNSSVPELEQDQTRHIFFLRVVNSYNKTQAVRLETGICRCICRNGIIFGKQSIQLLAPHHKTKQELMDYVAKQAGQLNTDELPTEIGKAYAIPLEQGMTVLEGVCQTLRLAIPPVEPGSRTAGVWAKRCASLKKVSEEYDTQFGSTAFSVLQAASQWGQEQAKNSPIQQNCFQRRCGEMLELLMTVNHWPEREQHAQEQIDRIWEWSDICLPIRGPSRP